ncbi:hypothetical protein F0L74_30660 [Chitinophaga agrisoli]|uniref:DUF5678 domain-containing protein n=1 Tax=Chitinophaga agrisoli TaxID=2607653 RepID=A0A5B2VQ35_9BACT|nr:hypothetical protein [Chitinophaga agrisoli]KAA2240516.1 hypothetical protein F0L74_30660 [Chitinophaga agrisoli]
MLEKELQYYIDNQEQLVNLYNGKHLIIKDEQVQGAYDTFEKAYATGFGEYEPGTFIIQHCFPGKASYSAAIWSPRVLF